MNSSDEVYENNMYNNQNNYDRSNSNYAWNTDNNLWVGGVIGNRTKRKPIYKKSGFIIGVSLCLVAVIATIIIVILLVGRERNDIAHTLETAQKYPLEMKGVKEKNKDIEISEDITVYTATEPEENVTVENVEKNLSKDFDNYYPKSVRDVVLSFISIQECYYNEDIETDKIERLAHQAIKLFDEKLVESNPFDKYYEELTKEIERYKTEGKTLYSTILDKASEVEYSEIEGIKYARINCIYYFKSLKGTYKVTETYVLKCDDKGNWKILGWKAASN